MMLTSRSANESRLFYRLHWHVCPKFSRNSAFSTNHREDADEEKKRGYSACDSAERLLEYFREWNGRTWVPEYSECILIVFSGYDIGLCDDGEYLVIPERGGKRYFCDPAALELMAECDSEEEIINLARQYRVPAKGKK